MNYQQVIAAYEPVNEQEAIDKAQILTCMTAFSDVLTRHNTIAHFTCSGLVFNTARTHLLMIHHNIYQSWGWTGGHADGECDFLAVATREVLEETGVTATPITTEILSLDVLTVVGHTKKGQYVSPHLHLNVTYVFEAPHTAVLTVNAEENSAIAWIACEELEQYVNEEHMIPIYKKIINRVQSGNQ